MLKKAYTGDALKVDGALQYGISLVSKKTCNTFSFLNFFSSLSDEKLQNNYTHNKIHSTKYKVHRLEIIYCTISQTMK